MMRFYPHHGLEQWLIIHTFYNGLMYNTKLTLDTVAGDALRDKPYQDTYKLIETWRKIITIEEVRRLQ